MGLQFRMTEVLFLANNTVLQTLAKRHQWQVKRAQPAFRVIFCHSAARQVLAAILNTKRQWVKMLEKVITKILTLTK